MVPAAAEALLNATQVNMNVMEVTPNSVQMDLGHMNIVLMKGVIIQQDVVTAVPAAVVAHRNAHPVSINAVVLIHTIVHMVLGHQINIVQTAVIHQLVNAKAVQVVEVQQGTNRVLALLAV